MEEPEVAARAGLRRSLLIYTLLFATAVAVVVFIVQSGVQGAAYVTVSVVGVVALLLGYQVVQHYRDLRAPLTESVGVIQRKWSRADLVIAWQSHYIVVNRTVFRISPLDFAEVSEDTYVKIVHFPNTNNVVSVHRV